MCLYLFFALTYKQNKSIYSGKYINSQNGRSPRVITRGLQYYWLNQLIPGKKMAYLAHHPLNIWLRMCALTACQLDRVVMRTDTEKYWSISCLNKSYFNSSPKWLGWFFFHEFYKCHLIKEYVFDKKKIWQQHAKKC